jgi:hypothetical protein
MAFFDNGSEKWDETHRVLSEHFTWRLFWILILCLLNITFFATVRTVPPPDGTFRVAEADDYQVLLLELIEHYTDTEETTPVNQADLDQVQEQIEYVSEKYNSPAQPEQVVFKAIRPFNPLSCFSIYLETLSPPPKFCA